MAKGQQRANKEIKKPRQDKRVVVPASAIIPLKSSTPPKK